MYEILKTAGICLIGFGAIRLFQLNFSFSLPIILSMISGVLILIAGYTNSITSLFTATKIDTDIATELTKAEQVDAECVKHLSVRFANDSEALALLRKLNDRLFSLHHPEKVDANINS